VSPPHVLSATDGLPSVEALNARAHALRHTDVRAAVELTSRAIDAADDSGDAGGCIRALRIRGSCLARLAEMDGALRDLDRADALLLDTQDTSEQGWVVAARADVQWRLGTFADAKRSVQHALEIHRASGDRSGEADSLNLLGVIADHAGDYASALESYQSGRILCESENDMTGLASALGNIAAVHGLLGEYERAIQEYGRALVLLSQCGNRSHEANMHINLAYAYTEVGTLDLARVHINEGLRIARELGDRKNEVHALINVGLLHRKCGDPLEARRHMEDALALCVTLRLPNDEIRVRYQLGMVLQLLGEYVEAVVQLHAALAMAESTNWGSPSGIHFALSELYRAAGDFERALHHYSLFHETKESACHRSCEIPYLMVD
jgi:tetratricopeptide (TPR) repeat protein